MNGNKEADMESVYFINGYDKVNYLVDGQTSDHSHKHSAAANHRKATVISILFILLVVAAVASISATDKPPNSALAAPLLSAESIQIVCSVSRSPNSCITTLSSLNNFPPKPDPELLFIMSLYISLAELKNLSSLPEILIAESNDPKTVSALRDCEFLFNDAVSQLNKSINSVCPGETVFTRRKIREVNAWISAAMTDEETCLDGLEEMGSTVLDEVRMRVQKSKKCMSNSLAILAKIHPPQNDWA